MSKLVSMKVTKAEREKRMEPSSIATDAPMYPWGLSINLDDESLGKLGIDVADLEVGATMAVIATVEVSSVSKNDDRQGGARQSATLQITAMCLEDEGAADAAAELYKEE